MKPLINELSCLPLVLQRCLQHPVGIHVLDMLQEVALHGTAVQTWL